MILTVGITACYRSDVTKFKRMIISLFDADITNPSTIDEGNAIINRYNSVFNLSDVRTISVSAPIEVIVYFDRNTPSPNDNINAMSAFVENLSIPNVTFRTLHSTQNVRVSVARNNIIKASTSKFICFRDDDDLSVNVNVLIDIVKSSPPVTEFIETYMLSYDYASRTTARAHLLSVVNCIISRQFLLKNKLFFIPDIGNEDAYWRADIYSRYPRMHVANVSTYIYAEPSGRSNITDFSRYNGITKYIDPDMRDDSHAEELVKKVLDAEFDMHGCVELNSLFLKNLNKSVAAWNTFPIIVRYMRQHADHFDIEPFINMTAKINGSYPFNVLPETMKKQCYAMFCKYLSFSDLYQLSRGDLGIMNKLYGVYETPIVVWGTWSQRLNEFTYRYLFMRCVAKVEVPDNFEVDEELVNNVRMYVDSYMRNIRLGDVILFGHDTYARKMKKFDYVEENYKYHDILNHMTSVRNNGGDLCASMKKLLSGKFDDEFISIMTKTYLHYNSVKPYLLMGAKEDFMIGAKNYSATWMCWFVALLLC